MHKIWHTWRDRKLCLWWSPIFSTCAISYMVFVLTKLWYFCYYHIRSQISLVGHCMCHVQKKFLINCLVPCDKAFKVSVWTNCSNFSDFSNLLWPKLNYMLSRFHQQGVLTIWRVITSIVCGFFNKEVFLG